MNPEHEKFIKNLIKGKIAEIIFEQMFRESGNYTILHSGYEYSLQELSQYQHLAKIKAVIENISNAPDFVLISQDKTEVYFVEVKYRTHPKPDDLKEICEETLKRWDHCWLFLATPRGFFFEPCHTVVNNDGHMESYINEKFVPLQVRDEYLQLLNEFER